MIQNNKAYYLSKLGTLFLWTFIFLSLSCSYEFLPPSMRGLFILFMILISTVAHYRCVESNDLFQHLFVPDPVNDISVETITSAKVELSWRNPATKDFKETRISWTRSQGEPGSEPARPGAPGSFDQTTLTLEPDVYTFTLTAVDAQGDMSRPMSSAPLYVGPPCHLHNPAFSSLRNRDFSSDFNLSNFSAQATADGFRSLGENGSDLGNSIAFGDINGDGVDDVLIGASSFNGDTGKGYVIFGKESGLMNIDLSLAGGDGFEFTGAFAHDFAGYSISSGDINGDGFDDVLVGAHQRGSSPPGKGVIHVIFGSDGMAGSPPPLDDIDFAEMNPTAAGFFSAAKGFTVTGEISDDFLGSSVSSGDINGDGIDDVLIGAYGADVNGMNNAGTAYVIFGSDGMTGSPPPLGDIELSTLSLNPMINGFKITGAGTYNKVGSSISSGDINGDGIDDILVGAPQLFGSGGSSYVIFGSDGMNGRLPLNHIDLSIPLSPVMNGFKITGVFNSASDFLGRSISSGDINGDGIDDVLVGANFANDGGMGTGMAYVIFGSNSPANITLSYNASNNFGLGGTPDKGFRIRGVSTNHQLGNSISSGDINGDGIDDVFIGAIQVSSSGPGTGYVIFGSDGMTGSLPPLSDINLTAAGVPNLGGNPRGFRILGENTNDRAGYSISSGDINGDSIHDVLIGAPEVGSTGAGYTVFGACQP